MPPHAVMVIVSYMAGSGEGTVGTIVHVQVQEVSLLAYLVHVLGAMRQAQAKPCTLVHQHLGCCAQELRVLWL
ncbi:hypothetical protein Y1Q_0004386 [Alligator mississippiensis]|uniref:Uncharacterized protein n=1 Tax=Alligator mississippiensis TaxID=8496 RepID=A0A151NQ38_ALLMI|nr:hypothetical protein Y1Q_0004386 [Alligator mississippiensis]